MLAENIDISALTADDVKSLIEFAHYVKERFEKAMKPRMKGWRAVSHVTSHMKDWELKIYYSAINVIQQCEKTTPHQNPVNQDHDA